MVYALAWAYMSDTDSGPYQVRAMAIVQFTASLLQKGDSTAAPRMFSEVLV